MRSRSYSRVSRSWMISRWRRPRKPQRKPKPRAALDSVSKEKLASLRRSLLMLSRNFSKSAASMGQTPQKTTGWTSSKPGRGAGAGAAAVGRAWLADGVGQFREGGGVHGEEAAEDDRLDFLEARERGGGGLAGVGGRGAGAGGGGRRGGGGGGG